MAQSFNRSTRNLVDGLTVPARGLRRSQRAQRFDRRSHPARDGPGAQREPAQDGRGARRRDAPRAMGWLLTTHLLHHFDGVLSGAVSVGRKRPG